MTSTKQNERRAQWQLLIIQQQTSGLTQKVFCEQHSLSLAKFSYYKSLMKEKPSAIIEAATKEKKFSEIKIAKPVGSANYSGDIKIILPNGFQCIFPASTDSTHLKSLLGVLISC